MDEQPLSGGNTHAAILRAGDTVRRPIGPWTPGVHALLAHLGTHNVPAPRALGIDERGREILSFIPGDVVWPGHVELVRNEVALESLGRSIRTMHDAVADFASDPAWTWSDRAADPSGSTELLCHNDLGIWNLVSSGEDWIYIDWDLAAPGRRAWDVSLALLSAVSLMPSAGVDQARTLRRIRAFVRGYGADVFPPDTLEVAVERCGIEARMIEADAARGDTVAQRLLDEGHADTWRAAERHIASNRTAWQVALG
ncbi:MAG: phosphotransferase [Actinomycetota bacterium]|nr:phosphotransferase [Actinomycetota bacterium]